MKERNKMSILMISGWGLLFIMLLTEGTLESISGLLCCWCIGFLGRGWNKYLLKEENNKIIS